MKCCECGYHIHDRQQGCDAMEEKTPDSRTNSIFQFQLPFLSNPTHEGILEAKEFYDSDGVQHFGRHTNSCVRSFPMFCEPKRLI